MRHRVWSVVRRLRPRHGTIVGYVALTLALSGAAYAAGTVGSADITDNSIRSVDLRDGAAVAGADIIDNSLTGADIREASLRGVARTLLYEEAAATSTPYARIATIGGYRLDGWCHYNDVNQAVGFELSVAGPGGTIDWAYIKAADQANPANEQQQEIESGGRLVGTGRTILFGIHAYPGYYSRAQGTFYIRSGSTLVQLDVDGEASQWAGGKGCVLRGTGTVGA